MASIFTEWGYAQYEILCSRITTDRLLIARRRALVVEKYRYHRELAGTQTPPAREKQLEIEIIEAELRKRNVKFS